MSLVLIIILFSCTIRPLPFQVPTIFSSHSIPLPKFEYVLLTGLCIINSLLINYCRLNAVEQQSAKASKAKASEMSPELLPNGISPTRVIVTTSTPPNDANDSSERIQDLIQLTANISENSSLYSSRDSNATPNRSSESASSDIKRKSVNRSRDKKFHRHFKQVAADEEVINCTYKHHTFQCPSIVYLI